MSYLDRYNHFCRPTTATANAINERDAAPDAAIR